MNQKTGLNIYLLFAVSWFLHLGARLPFLGVIRFDLLLVCVLAYLAFVTKGDTSVSMEDTSANKGNASAGGTRTDKMLRLLIAYLILTIPLVYWPGSVINTGIANFIKAVVFYYFTVAFVHTEQDIKRLVFVFVSCQVFRILEPLYLHVTEDYWGSVAYMSAGAEALDRLSGAPSDVVNPNGLAFIVCTVLPFLHLMGGLSWKMRVAALVLAPACIYVLILTGSRSGIVGLAIVFLGILAKSKQRFAWAAACVLVVVIGFPLLSPDIQDRYLSIVGSGKKNEGTAEGRWTGIEDSLIVAFHRPIFGHGLGTSREANANFGGVDQASHNLYTEVAQELGFVGLAIYILLLKSIYSGFVKCKQKYNHPEVSAFLRRLIDSMQILVFMNCVFSFASYGLSSYEWYFLGGLSVSMQKMAVGASAKAFERKGARG